MNSARPKVLQTAGGLPLLHYVLDTCAELFATTTVVVGHGAEAVREAFGHRSGLRFALQQPQNGTGHAVQVALQQAPLIPGVPIMVLPGDAPLLRPETLRRLARLREERGAAVALLSFRAPDPSSYGRVLRGAEGSVLRIVESKDASDAERLVTEVNASVYVFDAGQLAATIHRLRPDNAQAEFYLTDVVGLLAASGERVEALVLDDPSEASGVNTPAELSDVERALYSRRAMVLVSAGVVMERPDTILVGPFATVRPGARIRAFTILEGRSVVEGGASIGPFCRIEDSTVGADASILDSCLVRQSQIGAGASVGPFAHVRPASVVGEKAKIGNFVELKKTTLGPGAKAPHLSYLGDATVGAGANIGAGTITCNYDGSIKSPTTIGAGAFVGSNSILVAPVTIGQGAYIAAGSVITEDVPEGALGVARSRQENKAGWASRRAKKP